MCTFHLQLPPFLLGDPAIAENFERHNELLEELPDSFTSGHPGSNVSTFDFGGQELKVRCIHCPSTTLNMPSHLLALAGNAGCYWLLGSIDIMSGTEVAGHELLM